MRIIPSLMLTTTPQQGMAMTVASRITVLSINVTSTNINIRDSLCWMSINLLKLWSTRLKELLAFSQVFYLEYPAWLSFLLFWVWLPHESRSNRLNPYSQSIGIWRSKINPSSTPVFGWKVREVAGRLMQWDSLGGFLAPGAREFVEFCVKS